MLQTIDGFDEANNYIFPCNFISLSVITTSKLQKAWTESYCSISRRLPKARTQCTETGLSNSLASSSCWRKTSIWKEKKRKKTRTEHGTDLPIASSTTKCYKKAYLQITVILYTNWEGQLGWYKQKKQTGKDYFLQKEKDKFFNTPPM